MSNASITTSDLSIGYANRVVQQHLSLCFERGEMVCMLGPNGCGKSTLLRTLAGLQPALGGNYAFSEKTATATTTKTELPALVLTEHEAMDSTTVHDIVAMGRYHHTSFLGGLTDEDEQIIADALDAVGMSPLALSEPCSRFGERGQGKGASFTALSDGEKARVLIAKALAQQTDVILLDEPTAHLDLPNRIHLLRLLRRLAHEQQKTVLISTHELELALSLSDRILLLSPDCGGAVLDTAEALKKADAFATAFGMDIFNPLTSS